MYVIFGTSENECVLAPSDSNYIILQRLTLINN